MPAHVAVLDGDGCIIAVNQAWRRFAGANALPAPQGGVGLNYLEICDRAQGAGAEEASAAAVGIRRVLNGTVPEFNLEYPCHSQTEKRWFQMTVAPLSAGTADGVMVTHSSVTARHEAEEALGESQDRFQQLSASIDDVFWLTDAKKNQMLYISPAYERIWGRSCQSLLESPRNWLEAVHADDRERIRQAAVGKQPLGTYDEEFRILRPDGSLRWIRDRAYPIRDAGGEVYRIAGVARDITLPRAAGEKLRQNETMLRIAGQAARLGGWTLDLPEQRLSWSDEMCAIHEVPAGTAPSVEQAIQFYAPQWRERFRQILGACAGAGDAFDEPLQIVTARGRRVWVRAIGQALRDAGGGITRVQGALQDITEQKHAEEAVRLSEERFRIVAKAAADAIWDWDLQTDLVWWGDGMHSLFGFLPQELEPGIESWTRHIHPDDHERVLAGIDAAIAGAGEAWSDEYRFCRRDGVYAYVMDRAFIIRDADGKPLRMIGGMADLTERRLAEMKLAAHAEQLARSNEDLERFATIASHDLKEPLRTVSSYTQLLVRRYAGQGQAEVDEYAGYIVGATRRMHELIEGLLAYSRMTRGESVLELIELDGVLQQALANLHGALAETGGTVTCGALPVLPGNPLLLTQLFQNLIGNSLKFRSDMPPKIRIEARREHSHWLISVEDNGIGIDPRHGERIFVLFQRLHAEDRYPGSGLGLAICKRIVALHGGRIWVEPAPPGSRFAFTLPAAE